MREAGYFRGYYDSTYRPMDPIDVAMRGSLFAEGYELGLIEGEESDKRNQTMSGPYWDWREELEEWKGRQP